MEEYDPRLVSSLRLSSEAASLSGTLSEAPNAQFCGIRLPMETGKGVYLKKDIFF